MISQVKNYGASRFIGEQIGLRTPVFFDPHTSIYNNSPNVMSATGAPGSGKSTLMKTITAQSAEAGKTVCVIDAKGEFAFAFAMLKQGGHFEPKIQRWDITGRNIEPGILDPFYLAEEKSDKIALTIDVLSILLGSIVEERADIINPVVSDVADLPVPSLMKVIEFLDLHPTSIGRSIAQRLSIFSKMKYSQVFFAPGSVGKRKVPDLSSGLTIITLVGLDLPTGSGEKDLQDESKSTRVSSAIFFLVTDFVKKMMSQTERTHPKLLVIDEAQALTRTKNGRKIIKDVAEMGRSHSLAMFLGTPSLGNLSELDIKSTYSTRFFFKVKSSDAQDVISQTSIPKNEGYEEVLVNLNPGECLVEDWRGQHGTIKVTRHNQYWNEAFESNPGELLKRQQSKGNKK